nr:hypothetical protein [uncultured Mucilaginibacter sp.]
MTNFERYKQLKSQIAIVYNSIDFSKALSFECSQIAFNKQSIAAIKFTDLFKFCYASRDVTKLVNAFKEHATVLTTVYTRKDYEELIEKSFFNVKDFVRVTIDDLPYKSRFSFSLSKYLLATKLFFQFSGLNLSLKERVYLATRFIYQANFIDFLDTSFEGVDVHRNKYIAFNSAFDIETVLTLFLNKKGVDTYHFSHGLSYITFKYNVPIDILNTYNISAKKVLVWGQSSKIELLSKTAFLPGDIFIAGNPKYADRKIDVKKTFSSCIIFLGRSIYDSGNIELLKLVALIKNRYDINFTVKAHPASQQSLFLPILNQHGINLLSNQETINSILASNEYDFAVSYNTNAYFEALYNNLICFRYGVGENEGFDCLDDVFTDEESFNSIIIKYRNMDDEKINKAVTDLLVTNVGMGLNRYSDILK